MEKQTKYNYKLLLTYDGSCYAGWQIQLNAVSIQALIEEAIYVLLHEKVTLIASGRTDAGVHALEQVAHFKTHKEIDFKRFLRALNGLLPRDIRILAIEAVPLSFHAQYDALSKIYHYHLHLDPVMNPFRRLYCYQILGHFDLNLLEQAAAIFVGTHDFTTFANQAHLGSAARNPIRTLQRLDVKKEEGGVRLEFESNGFLYKMVRNITGTLVEVARGKRPLHDIPLLFAERDRRKAGLAAPPKGLFLVKVNYTAITPYDSEGIYK